MPIIEALDEQETKAYMAGDAEKAGLYAELSSTLQELDSALNDAADLRAELTNAAEGRDRLRAKVAHLEANVEMLKTEVRKLAKIKDIISR